MRNFKGFIYFFQSGAAHSDAYFIECVFVSSIRQNNLGLLN
jgi:hypothetical protein